MSFVNLRVTALWRPTPHMNKPSALWFRLKLQLPLLLRLGLLLLLVLVLALGAVFALRGCSFAVETVTSGGRLLEGADPQDSYLAFGEKLLRFDGQRLTCYNRNAEELWQYQAADGDGFVLSASDTRAALFSGSKLILLDERGNAVYNGVLEGTIAQVRCGLQSTAVELEGSEQLFVLDRNGAQQDAIDLSGASLIDFGFYSNNDLLWTLLINVSGLAPSSRLDIYQPGKELVSSYKSDTQLYYKPLFYQDDVYIVGTEGLDLVAGKSTGSRSIFGWQYAGSAVSGGGMAVALTLRDEGETPSMTRIFRGGSFSDMHLPAGCFYLLLGEEGLYAVGSQTLYRMPFDGGSMESYAFRYTVSQVLCSFSGYMALAATDGQVYLVKLP